jgi:hypothetical protein
MKDLDENILSFTEVVNYKAYIKDKSILLIELFTLDEDKFYNSYQKIMDSVRNIPSIKDGLDKDSLQIILKHSKENIRINNSMVKRKMHRI